MAKIKLCCDHIGDKDVCRAVYFAISMIRSGEFANIANARAAKYYGVPTSKVAHFVGQHAARIGSSKRNMRKARK